MGADLKMNDGDIGVTINGDIKLITENEEIVQMAINNMSTILGELEFDTERGNQVYHERIKINDEGMKRVAYHCKNAILQDDRVSDVPYIEVNNSTTDEYGCEVVFAIQKQDGTIIDGNTSIIIR